MQLNYKNIACLVIVLVVLLFSNRAEALVINGYDANVFDRFTPGTYASNPANNPHFFANSYDFSGVGWQSNAPGKSVALISPQHFVGANHYKVPVGSSVTFYNGSDQLKSYTVDSYYTFAYESDGITHIPDLVLGRLSESVDSEISHYKVLDADDYTTDWYDINWYMDKDIYAYGRNARVGENKIDYFSSANTKFGQNPDNATTCAVYNTNLSSDAVGQAGAQGGDSGSPSFIPYEDELTLLGTHFAINGDTTSSWRTYDSFIAKHLDEIDGVLGADGYQVERIDIDVFPHKLENGSFETWNHTQAAPANWEFEHETSGGLLSRQSSSTEYTKAGGQSFYNGEWIFPNAGSYNHNTYMHQTLDGAREGQEYAFSFWFMNTIEIARNMLVDDAQLRVMAGIDPTGGTDPDSDDIIWQMFILSPDELSQEWQQVIVSAMAAEGSTAMTFFIGREVDVNIYAADAAAGKYWNVNTYFDDSQINSVPEPATIVLFGFSLFSLLGLKKKKTSY
jgi:hypothetical protein